MAKIMSCGVPRISSTEGEVAHRMRRWVGAPVGSVSCGEALWWVVLLRDLSERPGGSSLRAA
eukprot:7614764-Alexandrium_andersonii.AAC.1